jgi:hypothetical protein
MMNGETVLIVATMKNEGPYILEWVAHHLSIGVDHILVFTNDCDDLTDRILDRLEQIAPVYHRPNPKALLRGDKGNWHVMALRYARMFNVHKDAGWIYYTDADELLQIKSGKGMLEDFYAAARDKAGDFQAVSFTSIPFSSAGLLALEDRPMIEQFTQTTRPYAQLRAEGKEVKTAVKSIYRNDVAFDLRRNHRPRMQGFSAAGHVWVDGSGQVLPAEFTDGSAKVIDSVSTTEFAQVNHYAVKSAEAFLVKLDRGDAMGLDRLDSNRRYWEKYNTSGDEDARFIKMRPATRKLYDELCADPTLAELHEQSFAIHKAKAERLQNDPDWAEMSHRIGFT